MLSLGSRFLTTTYFGRSGPFGPKNVSVFMNKEAFIRLHRIVKCCVRKTKYTKHLLEQQPSTPTITAKASQLTNFTSLLLSNETLSPVGYYCPDNLFRIDCISRSALYSLLSVLRLLLLLLLQHYLHHQYDDYFREWD